MKNLINLIVTIKNGYLAKKDFVVVPYTHLSEEVVKLLKKEGYIKDYHTEEDGKKKSIKVFLLYKDRRPVLTDIEIVSKPGIKIYSRVKELKPVLGGFGIAILSTSKGIKTDKEAIKERVGGELLSRIW